MFNRRKRELRALENLCWHVSSITGLDVRPSATEDRKRPYRVDISDRGTGEHIQDWIGTCFYLDGFLTGFLVGVGTEPAEGAPASKSKSRREDPQRDP